MARSFQNWGSKMRKKAALCKEKLVLLYFVMASQASYICFSFTKFLEFSTKKRSYFLAFGNRRDTVKPKYHSKSFSS